MKMKRFIVAAEFPRAVAHETYQSAQIMAANFPLAAKRGLAEMMKRPGIKGLRHKTMRLSIVEQEGGAG
jgi:hypothetical protein